jgi:thiamine pyrophosphate-dependent acetolactate synthase large subunit-like protein
MAHTGDLVAEMLTSYGVTHVFGQPGGQTAALYDGIARRSPIPVGMEATNVACWPVSARGASQ